MALRAATAQARQDGITGPRKAAGRLEGCAVATCAVGIAAGANIGYQLDVLAGLAVLVGAVVAAVQIYGQAAMLRWLAVLYETAIPASPSAPPADRPPPRPGWEA
jgi:hypothetical protein